MSTPLSGARQAFKPTKGIERSVSLAGPSDLRQIAVRDRRRWRQRLRVIGTLLLGIMAPMLAHGQGLPDHLTLAWTDTGDDGMVGRASVIEVRMATSPITLANWPQAILLPGAPRPGPAGTRESMIVSGLATYTVYYFAVRLADEAGNWSDLSNVVRWDRTDAGACGGSNLAPNPSFESGTQGWLGVSGTPAVVPGGSDGSASCRITSRDTIDTFGLDDHPDVIAGTSPGATYHFSAWVRSDVARSPAKIKVREYLNRIEVGSGSSPIVMLSPSWQELALDYIAIGNGSTLDLTIRETPTAPSESFDVDEVSICGNSVTTTGVEDPGHGQESGSPSSLAPNPVVGQSALRFSTVRPGRLRVAIHDVSGRRVRELLDVPDARAGLHVQSFDGRGDNGARLGTGIYFYSIDSADGHDSGHFLILR